MCGAWKVNAKEKRRSESRKPKSEMRKSKNGEQQGPQAWHRLTAETQRTQSDSRGPNALDEQENNNPTRGLAACRVGSKYLQYGQSNCPVKCKRRRLVEGGPAISNNTIYYTSFDGVLYAASLDGE